MAADKLLDALLVIGHDALAGVGLAPSVKGIYHGAPPEQCCTPSGSLYVWWGPAFLGGVDRFPARHRGEPVTAGQNWQLGMRWWRSFPTITDDGFDQQRADETARDFARGTEAVLAALDRQVCNPQSSTLQQLAACDGRIVIADATIGAPQGGAAYVNFGVTITNQAAP